MYIYKHSNRAQNSTNRFNNIFFFLVENYLTLPWGYAKKHATHHMVNHWWLMVSYGRRNQIFVANFLPNPIRIIQVYDLNKHLAIELLYYACHRLNWFTFCDKILKLERNVLSDRTKYESGQMTECMNLTGSVE